MTPSKAPPLKVALFNPIFAHYRRGLVRELLAHDELDISLFADSTDAHDGIPTLDLSSEPRYVRAPRLKFGRLTWQRGVLRAALGDYDVYIFTGSADYLTSWVGALVARIRGRRVLFWTHGWTRVDRSAKRVVRNAFYGLSHAMLLYGERARKLGIETGFDADRLHVIYNSLDFDHQQTLRSAISDQDSLALRSELFGDRDTPVVIASARLTAVKRFDLLIRSLGLLHWRGKHVNLILVGDGPERDELKRLADANRVKVAFIGACYDETRVARLYACANVTVSPGNVGLTCMHSLGYGVPVITHDNPDDQMPEWEAIVPGICGALFQQNDAESLSQAIADWTQSPRLSQSTRERCIAALSARYHPRIQSRRMADAIVGEPARAADEPLAI